MRIAVLGTGIMGAGMARSLAREGHAVSVWNRTRDKAEAIAGDGISVADSIADAVSAADAVITMLYDTEATLGVAEEVGACLGADAVWIQAGTLGPDGARRLAEVAPRGLLDAPVLGTKKPAEDGKLIVLVSGPAAAVDTARPVFEAIGIKTVVAGDQIGQASALKLVVNSWIALITAGTAQALGFAEALGIDPALFLTAIEGAPVDSPYAHVKGAAMISQDWTTSFTVDGVSKDVGLMIDAAHAASFPTELLEAVLSLFRSASDDGHGSDDMAAVRTAFDR